MTHSLTGHEQCSSRQLQLKERGFVEDRFGPMGSAGRHRDAVPHENVLPTKTQQEDTIGTGNVEAIIANRADFRL